VKLKCRDLYFPNDPVLQVDLRQVLDEVIGALNLDTEAYEDNLRDARALAEKLGVAIDPTTVPARQFKNREMIWGPIADKDGCVQYVQINGDLAGVSDIAGASRLIHSLTPRPDRYLAP